ncbi:MAG: acyltransferase domain-containing protein, partial [Myxococcota bacterium]
VFESPAPRQLEPWRSQPQALLAASAADEEAQRQRLAQYAEVLTGPQAESPVHVATMATRARGARAWRAATVLTPDSRAATERLGGFAQRAEAAGVHVFVATRPPQTAWMFPGEGVQRAGVLLRLASRFPSFAPKLARASELFGEVEGRGLTTWLGDDIPPALLEQAAVRIPLVVTVEVALAQWLMDKGWEPDYVVGHGVGEFAAAFVAGAFDDAQTITRAKALGAMVQRAPGGALAAVRTRRESVEGMIAKMGFEVSVAAVNAPNELALAGAPDALDAICDYLGARGVPVAREEGSHAMHTSFMEDVREQILAQPAAWTSNPVRIPISLGALDWVVAPGEVIAPDYWGHQIAEAVDFQRAMTPIASMVDVLVEVGLSRALTSYARRHPLGQQTQGFVLLGEGADELESALDVFGAMWARGVDMALEVAPGDPGVRMPTYPFQRRARWIAQPRLEEVRASGLPPVANHPVVRRCVELKMDIARFTLELGVDDPLVSERSVHGVHMLPLTAVLEAALAAVQRVHRDTPWGLSRVSVSRPIVARGDGTHAHVQLEHNERFTFHVLTDQDEPAVMGQVLMDAPARARTMSIEAVRARATGELGAGALAAMLAECGVVLGAYFQCVHDVYLGLREALAVLKGPREPRFDEFLFHPAMVDAALHLATALVSVSEPARRIALEPVAVDRLVVRGVMPRECVVHVTMDGARDGGVSTFDVVVATSDGRPVVELHRVSARPVEASSLADAPVPLFSTTWEEYAAPGAGMDLEVVRAPRGEAHHVEAVERLVGALKEAQGDVLVVTRGALTKGEELDPSHAAFATVALGWGLEQVDRSVHVLDVGPGVGESELALALSRRPPGALLRWQDGRFFKRSVHPLASHGASPAEWGAGMRAVFVDVSGTAADLARELAERWRAHIVLVGRAPLEEEEEQVKLMRELERLGAASRTYVEANVQSAVGRAMAAAGIREAIDGVDLFVQGVGELEVQRLDAADLAVHRDVYARRVSCAQLVESLDAEGLEPAQVVVLSSMFSQDVQASSGFVVPAAAGAYLEAWCAARRASGRRAVHVAMPLVQEAIDAEESARVLATRGIAAVTSAQAVAAVLAALATGDSSVLVGHVPGDWTGRADVDG